MALPEDVVHACAAFSQGDLIDDAPIVLVADLRRPLTAYSAGIAATLGSDDLGEEALDVQCAFGIIVSQTCDVRSDTRPTIKLAPVYELEDPDAVESLKRGERRRRRIDDIRSGRIVHKVMLDGPPGYFYADLETITTVEKTILCARQRRYGFGDADAYRQFAFRCGHVHDRPAVPDPIDRRLVNELRLLLMRLREENPQLFELLRQSLAEECLFLDDWTTPAVAQLWFLGLEPPVEAVREVLDDWHANLPQIERVSVLPNRYHAFSDLSAAEYRDLRVISHWYLSMDEDEVV